MHDQAIAAIFCAHILHIVLATSTLIFRYGQGRSRAYLAIRSALLLLLSFKVHTPITHNDTG